MYNCVPVSLNKDILVQVWISGVRLMGGHLYWHECPVETKLDD